MKKIIKVGSDFSGVGAFDQALLRLDIDYKTEFACDMDKYARTTYIHNYGEPKYFPKNVYNREIPAESLDIYMTSPPCQAFSISGKRLGKDDLRGILFFNSHEFISKNKPRYFIFENVKGLLSDDNGKTFQEWINLLGGKSVNGLPILFSYEDSVPYHIYWKVINAKEHGIPQNRERIFIIGIRDDKDNNFRFPVEEHLTKRLKDVLEKEPPGKYFLSEKMIKYFDTRANNFNGGKINYKDPEDYANTITKSNASIDISDNIIRVCNVNPSGNGMNGNVFDSEGISPTLNTNKGEGIKITSESNKVIQLNQNKESNGKQPYQQNRVFSTDGICPALLANLKGDRNHNIKYNDRRLNETIDNNELPEGEFRILDTYNQSVHDYCPTLKKHHAENGSRKLWDGYKIRRLTPRECFRLMDFPDSFDFSCVSDSQAYKQAGNSIVVRVLEKIINNLNL
jgi:DNA (cytosine-5)-methyltransferase 1